MIRSYLPTNLPTSKTHNQGHNAIDNQWKYCATNEVNIYVIVLVTQVHTKGHDVVDNIWRYCIGIKYILCIPRPFRFVQWSSLPLSLYETTWKNKINTCKYCIQWTNPNVIGLKMTIHQVFAIFLCEAMMTWGIYYRTYE